MNIILGFPEELLPWLHQNFTIMKLILLCTLIVCSQLIFAQDWQQVGAGIDGNVICMAALDGKIYVGGNYTGDLNYISTWDPVTQVWTDISSDFISYAVMGMTVSGGRLYVSGLYQWTSGDIIAEYDPATGIWTGLGDADGVNGISEVFIKNNYIYIGGNGYSKKSELGSGVWSDMAETDNAAQVRGFAEVNGEMFVHKVQTVDIWDDYTFLTFDDATFTFAGEALNESIFDWFQDLEVVGTDIYCAGSFYVNTDYQRIARYDTETNTFSGLPGCPENTSYTALHHEGVIYFGGSFQSPYNHVVAYTVADGSWASVGSGLPAQVSDIVVLNDTLYAIGNFSDPIMHVAKFDLTPASNIQENEVQNLLVYPNPCEDLLFFEKNMSPDICTLYDISGKLVIRQSLTGNQIETTFLAPGCYTVVLEKAGKRTVVFKN
jgi:hypothetical protein